jgi:copper resistance protein D
VILAAGLIVSRFVHYLALSILFGGALFPFYGFGHQDLRPVAAWLRMLLLGAALLALASGISWLAFTSAGMSGELSAITDPAILSTVIRDTGFGRLWAMRLLLATGVAVLLLPRKVTTRRSYAVLIGSFLLLASIAWTGHAGADDSAAGLPHRIADALHLTAAGIWVGALFIFARLVIIALRGEHEDDLHMLGDALARFSAMGTVVVATLVLSGIANPGFLAGFKATYGRILLAKLAMFGGMLLLATANRFWLTPRLSVSLASKNGLKSALAALRLSLLTEAALSVLVLAAVAWLGTLSPTGQD